MARSRLSAVVSILLASLAGVQSSWLHCRSRDANRNLEGARPRARSELWFDGQQSQCDLLFTSDRRLCKWEVNVSSTWAEVKHWQVEATLQMGWDSVCTLSWSATGDKLVMGGANGAEGGLASVWQRTEQGSLVPWRQLAEFTSPETLRLVAFSPEADQIMTSSEQNILTLWHVDYERMNLEEADPAEWDRDEYFWSDGTSMRTPSSKTWVPRDRDRQHDAVARLKDSVKVLTILHDHGHVNWGFHWVGDLCRILLGSPDRTGCLEPVHSSNSSTCSARGSTSGDCSAGTADSSRSRGGISSSSNSSNSSSNDSSSNSSTSTITSSSSTTTTTSTSSSSFSIFEGLQSCDLYLRDDGTRIRRDIHNAVGHIWQLQPYQQPFQWVAEALLRDLESHSHLVLDVAWDPVGQRILTGSTDGIARIWELQENSTSHSSGRPYWDIQARLKGHIAPIWSVAWAPDGQNLLTASADNVTLIWESSPSPQPTPSSSSSDSTSDGTAFWNVVGILQEVRCYFTAMQNVTAVAYGGRDITSTVDGPLDNGRLDKLLIVSSLPDAFLVISGSTSHSDWCATGGFAITCSNGVSSNDIGDWEVYASSDSLDAEHMRGEGDGWEPASVAAPHEQSSWHLPADRFLERLCTDLNRSAEGVGHFAFRTQLATQVRRTRYFYRMRELNTVETLRQFQAVRPAPTEFFRDREHGHPPAAWCSAWDGGGSRIAVGSLDGTVRIWALRAKAPMWWEMVATLTGHTSVVSQLAWSPNGRNLATVGHDGLLRIWRDAPAEHHRPPPIDVENATGINIDVIDENATDENTSSVPFDWLPDPESPEENGTNSSDDTEDDVRNGSSKVSVDWNADGDASNDDNVSDVVAVANVTASLLDVGLMDLNDSDAGDNLSDTWNGSTDGNLSDDNSSLAWEVAGFRGEIAMGENESESSSEETVGQEPAKEEDQDSTSGDSWDNLDNDTENSSSAEEEDNSTSADSSTTMDFGNTSNRSNANASDDGLAVAEDNATELNASEERSDDDSANDTTDADADGLNVAPPDESDEVNDTNASQEEVVDVEWQEATP